MKQKRIPYIYAGILTIVLYGIGLLSGLYISRMASSSPLDIGKLESDIKDLQKDTSNLQLQQLYLTGPKDEIGCKFLVSDLSRINSNLEYFLSRLPQKLESYEKYGTDPNYQEIKRAYMLVSLKVWLLSLATKQKCGKDIMPILYFYSKNCEDCIAQGNALDTVRGNFSNVAVFTIDSDLNETIIKVIKEAYNITHTPSLIIGDKTYSGLKNHSYIADIIIG